MIMASTTRAPAAVTRPGVSDVFPAGRARPRTGTSIVANPLRFSLRRPPTRRVNLTPRFGAYYIAYMIWKEKVVILAVAHAKRRPYYWRKRIGEAKQMF